MADPIRDARRRVDAWLRMGGSSDTAVREASRIALFSAVPEMERSHEIVARGAVPRTTTSEPADGRQATRVHEVFFIVATVLGLVVPGLVALSPRSGDSALSLDVGAVPAGACALATLALFIWLEPYRRSSRFFAGHNAPPRLYLVYGIVWLLLAASIVILRWDEVDEPGRVTMGLVMMVAAAAGTVPLWMRARHADGVAPRRELDGAEPDMSRWWRDVDGSLTPREREAVAAVFAGAIDRLRERGVLTSTDAAAALERGAQAEWERAAR